MFSTSKAFSSFSVSDIQKAREFYSSILGLETAENSMGILELHFGENRIIVYPKPNHVPATFTVLNFMVPNIGEAVKALMQKGITFEQYNSGDIVTDEKGISYGANGHKIAWFKDPDGNILSLIEEM